MCHEVVFFVNGISCGQYGQCDVVFGNLYDMYFFLKYTISFPTDTIDRIILGDIKWISLANLEFFGITCGWKSTFHSHFLIKY